MGNVTYVKGIKGARATYPLGFSPTGWFPPSTAILLGAGTSDTYPEISSLAAAKFLEFHLKTTNVGADEVYGQYLSLQSGGTGTGYAYAYGALAKSVSGGYVAELGGCYFKTQLTAGTVTGQACVGFFEFIVDTGVANQPSGGVIQLVSIVNGSLSGSYGFISLRDYGTNPCLYFVFSPDNLLGDTKILRTNVHAPTHGLRCMVNSIAYDICLTDAHA